jgi:hypothetical protein
MAIIGLHTFSTGIRASAPLAAVLCTKARGLHGAHTHGKTSLAE